MVSLKGDDKQLIVAMPLYGAVPAPCFENFLDLRSKLNALWVTNHCAIIEQNRNVIAQDIATHVKNHPDEVSYVLWLDYDILATYDKICKLIEVASHHRLEILSALYYQRRPHLPQKQIPAAFVRAKDNEFVFDTPEKGVLPIQEVDGVGFGCVLVKPEVIVKMVEEFERPFDCKKEGKFFWGEDLSFCLRAKELGYQSYLDWETKVDHFGVFI